LTREFDNHDLTVDVKPQVQHFLLPRLERKQHKTRIKREKCREWVLGFGYKWETGEKICWHFGCPLFEYITLYEPMTHRCQLKAASLFIRMITQLSTGNCLSVVCWDGYAAVN